MGKVCRRGGAATRSHTQGFVQFSNCAGFFQCHTVVASIDRLSNALLTARTTRNFTDVILYSVQARHRRAKFGLRMCHVLVLAIFHRHHDGVGISTSVAQSLGYKRNWCMADIISAVP